MEKRYIFIENGQPNGAGTIPQSGDNVVNAEVSDEIYTNYLNDPRKYTWQNDTIIENPQYEEIVRKDDLRTRISEITEALNELDKKRIRAVCEDEVKDERTGETWLDYYNAQIYDLRTERESLIIQLEN